MIANSLESGDLDAVVAIDVEGKVLYWDAGAERLFGWSARAMLGKDVHVLVPDRVRVEGDKIGANLVGGGQVWAGQLPLRRRGGDEVLVDLVDTPVKGPTGAVVAIIGVHRAVAGRSDNVEPEVEPEGDEDSAPTTPGETLSSIERDIAIRVASGRTNDEIAAQLSITSGSVSEHVQHILAKLGRNHRVQIATWVIQRGLPLRANDVRP